MKNFIRKGKWLWIVCLIIVLSVLCVKIAGFFYRKSADTSWIEDLGFNADELHTLKLDRTGCPLIPANIEGKTYYFNLDTGCADDVVVTNALENKIGYTILEQIEQLNRDGSHRGWSYGISLEEMILLGQTYHDIDCSMIDWKMSSSHKFNGLVGTAPFEDRIITIDYRAHMIGVREGNIDYSGLSDKLYAVVPMKRTQTDGQENLVFFECGLNDEKVLGYIDTGKNVSYIHNPESGYIIGTSMEKPDTACVDAAIQVGNISLGLHNIYEANIPQYNDFECLVALELNSDQLLGNDIVITFDFINENMIFFKR